jgi:hypothetical protein
MKPSEKTTTRDLFDELTEGMTALAESRRGDRILPTHTLDSEAPETNRERANWKC